MQTIPIILQRLAALGVAKPSAQLVTAIEARLAPHVTALVTRRLTKPMIARCFAATLIEAFPKGSEEGSAAPTLPSSPEASCDKQDKPPGVAGTTAAAASTVEAS